MGFRSARSFARTHRGLHALRREINEAFRANAPVAFPGERVACFPAKTKYFVQLVEPP
jgi:hypothetical protein